MVKMIKVNMTSWSTCERSTWHDGQHVKGQHDKEQQDEKVHPQVTIAVPDVGEENTGQGHHHLIGEKPRWPNIFTLFNFEESTPFGVLKAKLMTLLVSRVLLRKPPLKKSKVPLKYQVSLFILILIIIKFIGITQIPGLTTNNSPYPHISPHPPNKTFRSHFTS